MPRTRLHTPEAHTHAHSQPAATRRALCAAQTGRSYGERPPLVISPHLYPELDAFVAKWRASLAPTHGLLFTQ